MNSTQPANRGCCPPVSAKTADARPYLPRRADLARIAVVGLVIVLQWLHLTVSIAGTNVLGLVAVVVCGYPIFSMALKSILQRRMSMELSMTIALLAAVAISETLTALVILFFVLIAEELERFTIHGGRRSIKNLLNQLPSNSAVIRDGSVVEVPTSAVKIGDIVVTRPGSAVSVDGTVVSGQTFIDEAAITGEPIPSEKLPGSKVFAGTINHNGVIEIRAERVGEQTAFGKIISAVEEAERTKAKAQRIADRLAGYLVYFALAAAAFTLVTTWDLRRTISVVLVTGACGVAAGTPLALLGAIGSAARRGVIVKGGLYMEELATVDTIVFDKTGTLTAGLPHVANILPCFGSTPEQVLFAAAVSESYSEHPIARAILEAARAQNMPSPTPEEFKYTVGKGIQCRLEGRDLVVGNRSFFAELGIEERDDHRPCKHLTEVLVAQDGRMIGRIHISDQLRPESPVVIQEMKRLGLRTVLMTGDSPPVAAALSSQLGIDEYHAGLQPEDKRERVQNLISQGAKVLMVGDGINDAPALSQATVGVAIGSGTDVAIESANAVIIGNDLTKLVAAIEIARSCRRIIIMNFAGTIIVDMVGMLLALVGVLSPLLAALIHVGSELFFLLNSARLFRLSSTRSRRANSGTHTTHK